VLKEYLLVIFINLQEYYKTVSTKRTLFCNEDKKAKAILVQVCRIVQLKNGLLCILFYLED
jgi:hypothetical protein